MKRLLAIFLVVIPTLLWGQQFIVKFHIKDKTELKALSHFVSIDNVKGNTVRAYVWGKDNLAKLSEAGYKYTLLPSPAQGKSIQMATTVDQMANWDRYPTYDVYVQMMQLFAQNYPDICVLDTIGQTQEGRLLLALKITDNPHQRENEPEFFYTSTMHGDETTGFIAMLRLIDSLLTGYGHNSRITNLVNNIEIWINPLANPDGTYHGGNNTVSGAQRYYSNGVDPNRNFPDPEDGAHPDGNAYTVETIGMMNFAWAHNFTMSANFHGGAEVFNYPWDTWSSSQNPHADQDWFQYVGTNYVALARQINPSYMTDVTSSGITEGYDWYEVQGGRQDYMNYWHHCREVTVELSSTKLLDVEDLPRYWNYMKDALLYYMEQSLYGFRGVLMNSNGELLHGTVSVNNHDHDGSQVESDSLAGDYHRPIIAGTYDITASVNGYSDLTANITTQNEQATIHDFIFGGDAPTTNITFQIVDSLGNPIPEAEITVKNQYGENTYTTDNNGTIQIDNAYCGTYKFTIHKDGFMSLFFWETITPTNNSFVKIIPESYALQGYVINAFTGEPLPNATVSVSGLNSVYTDENGYYYLDGFRSNQSYQVHASCGGYQSAQTTITISENTANADFALLPVEGIGFEDTIPEGFTFGGDADWFRTNSQAYEGEYSMQSGDITDNQSTSMYYTATTVDGTMSFALKVSSEQGYDQLYFYIDGNEQQAWSGELDWQVVSFNVSAGTHTFEWKYQKDGSVSNGDDCAWVDLVSIPTGDITYPTANITFIANASGEPVQGAQIHLIGYGIQTTQNDGSALFQNVYRTNGTLSYIASLEGYNDISGNFTVFNDTTIILNFGQPTKVNSAQMRIYPNPTSDYLHITSLKPANCRIFSLDGKMLISRKLQAGDNIINLQTLQQGIYLIEVNNNDRVIQRKIVKY